MSMEGIIKYFTPKKELDGKKLMFVFVFIFAIFGLFMMIWLFCALISDFNKVLNLSLFKKFLLFIAIVMFPQFIYDWIRQIVELWINAYTVELTEEKIIGYTAWNKRKELRYEEIETIEKEKFMFHSMNLKDAGGKTRMTIHSGINGYGKCVEEIRRRSKNVKKVDYRGVDKKTKIWLDEHKRE